jgi:uncharacterized phage protein (TIGR02220 family)
VLIVRSVKRSRGMGRGVYRGIYSALPDDPDFQRLSPVARLTLYTVRLCAQAGPGVIFRYYPELLRRQTGLTGGQLERALAELEQERWIVREGVVLWVRNGLRHDPALRLTDRKHRAAVLRALDSLPRLAIVLTFCDYYGLPRPFEGPSEALARPIEGVARSGSPNTEDRRQTPYSPPRDPSKALENGTAAPAREILAWLNAKAGRNYRPVPANLDLIVARLRDGLQPYQLKAVVSRKVREWRGDPKMARYLRPETLFGKTKCEQYVGELPPTEAPDAGGA